MSTIERLGITGIRSYSPDYETQIRFQKPLTIILGTNGSGKSTIIEAVKMATTGDLPPMVSQGAAFINDPRIHSNTETRAKIRLAFRNVRGDEYTVSRQFLLRQTRPGKSEFKTIDQTLRRSGDASGSTSASHRCAEMNALLPEILRVTKPILNSVIFVHQEDSLWPLGDPKKLKERFDDIFAATRYTKALEAIRKFRKEQAEQIRLVEKDLVLHEVEAKHCEEIRTELDGIRAAQAKLRNGVTVIEAECDALGEYLGRAERIEAEFADVQLQLTTVNAKIAVSEATRDSQFASLGEELTDLGDAELEMLVGSLEDAVRKADTAKLDRQAQLKALRNESTAKSATHNRLQSTAAALRGEAEQQTQRLASLEELKEEYSTTLFSGDQSVADLLDVVPITESDSATWTQALERLRQKIEKRVEDETNARQAIEDRESAVVNDITIRISTATNTIARSTERAQRKRDEAAKKRTELRSIEGDEESVLLAQDEEKTLQARLDAMREAKTAQNAMERYESASRKHSELRESVLQLKRERNSLAQDEQARTAVQYQEKELSHKRRDLALAAEEVEETVRSLWRTASDSGVDLGAFDAGDRGGDGVSAALDKLHDRFRVVRQELASSASAAAKTHAQCETRMADRASVFSRAHNLVETLEGELSRHVDDAGCVDFGLLQVEGPTALVSRVESKAGVALSDANRADIATAVSRCTRKKRLAEKRLATIEYRRLVAEDHLEEFEASVDDRGKHSCPTCGTSTSKPDKVASMRAVMKEAVAQLSSPEHAETARLELERASASLDWAATLQGIADKMVVARNERESALVEKDEAQSALNASKQELQEAEEKAAAHNARFVESSVVREAERLREEWRAKAAEVTRLAAAVGRARRMLASDCDGQSISEVDSKIERLEEQVSELQKEMDTKRKEADAARDDLARVERGAQAAARRRLAAEEAISRRRSLEREKDEAMSAAQALDDEVAASREEVAGLRGDQQVASAKYEASREESRRLLAGLRKRVSRCSNAHMTWTNHINAVEAYERAGKAQELVRVERHCEQTRKDIDGLVLSLQELETQEATFVGTLREKERACRNARDNREYRATRTQLELYHGQARDFRRRAEQLADDALHVYDDVSNALRASTLVDGDVDAEKVARDCDVLGDGGSRNGSARSMHSSSRREPAGVVKSILNLLNERRGWKQATEGKAHVYTEQYAARKVELRKAERLGSQRKYEECRIKKQTMELATTDLVKYDRALEHALMAYHALKMDTINKTIKELWQITYRGTDIDEIEIVSDAGDEMKATASGTGAKRSYNYRVVMRRGDAKLDMRGRCSAGQKVLACLVIRLALAESFCADCGILALDEPTTNLDYANMESLACALRAIIENRRHEKHFQLILISHDQNFLSLMGARGFCNEYYYVSKDDNGNSVSAWQALSRFVPPCLCVAVNLEKRSEVLVY